MLTVLNYILLFIALYFQLFLLLTFLERPAAAKAGKNQPTSWPTVAVMVPCYNEEKSLAATVRSLLALDYPRHKLTIMIIDDGSADGTLAVARHFLTQPQVKIWHKANGGKHSALNFGLRRTAADIVGCLDADSLVEPAALKRVVAEFNDPAVMSVTPAIKVYRPKSWLQKMQKVEYDFGIFLRQLFGRLDALFVTPGPFSFFRRSVFAKVGEFRSAHQTEDLEMAMRLQAHGYRIKQVTQAQVYTVAPANLPSLYRQRRRWVTGFLKNAVDYRALFFRRRHGHLGLIVLPLGVLSVFAALFFTYNFLFELARQIFDWFVKWRLVGFDWQWRWDWFYVNGSMVALLTYLLLGFTLWAMLEGRRLAEGRIYLSADIFYSLILYALVSPLWFTSAVYNTLLARTINWR